MGYRRLCTSEIDESVSIISSEDNESSATIIGPTKDDSFNAVGYKTSLTLAAFFHMGGIISCGFLYLLIYWRPDWGVLCKKTRTSLEDADTLILTDNDGTQHVVKVQKKKINKEILLDYFKSDLNSFSAEKDIHLIEDTSFIEVKYFIFQYLQYMWNSMESQYECIQGLKKGSTVGCLLRNYIGYTLQEQQAWLKVHGLNEIGIEIKSYFNLLISEVLNPFYIFQIASITLWLLDEYYLYAICIFLISCLSIGLSLFEIRKQSESIQDLIEASSPPSVTVLRILSNDNSKVEEKILTSDVVPGDIIVIPTSGCVMACDAVLLSGSAIVNESMLTGESVPVTKLSFAANEEMEIFSPESHKKHMLFCGTTVIQTRYFGKDQVLALVVRTGFNTTKGELVRSILYPKPIDFKFYKDCLLFIGLLFLLALIGMSYSLYLYIIYSRSMKEIVVRSLDIITIVVPPALPAAMTVGTYYAQNRLKKLGIFCIAPARINVCGKIKLVCFDKTGTLTEEGLEVWGAVESHCGKGKPILKDPCSDISKLSPGSPLLAAFAACHSLTYVNGHLTGDPLDLKMFEATKWTLEEPGGDDSFHTLAPPIVKPSTRFFSSVKEAQHESGGDYSEVDSAMKRRFECKDIGSSVGGDISNLCHPSNTYKSGAIPRFRDNIEYGSKYFVSTPSLLDSPTEEVPYEIGIVRQLPFTSTVQRMSVIVRVLGSTYMEVFTKGAPEVIQTLCQPDSVPDNFSSVLNEFTMQGFRVLAVAHKKLSSKTSWHNVQKLRRDQLECELNFLGLLILQNVLKPETTSVIHDLKACNIRCVMVTGDNILTGICVARECGMVEEEEEVFLAKVTTDDVNQSKALIFEPAYHCSLSQNLDTKNVQVNIPVDALPYHLAISGPVWLQIKEHFPEYIPMLVSQGTIFARMSPDQKVQLVEELQAIDYIVGMCGDGANDCGALKAAHVGISLSEAEASVAAPFTSRTANITCVPRVICEGRCALTTNFSVFKYMALYSIIQFVSVIILYKACTILGDVQFLYIDLFIVTTIAIFMGYTKSSQVLVTRRPLSRLIGPVNLFSVGSQIVLVIGTQVLIYYYLLLQPWYTTDTQCFGPNDDDAYFSWETTAMFCFSSFQYLAVALIYSPGYPFREPIYTNGWLVTSLIILFATNIWLLIYPLEWMERLFGLKSFPNDPRFLFRGTIFLIAVFHFTLGWIVENLFVGSRFLKKTFHVLFRKKEPKNKYKRVKAAIRVHSNWPPVAKPIYSSIS